MRAFIGIELDEPVRLALDGSARALRRLLGDQVRALSFPRPESLHLTLKFLGDTDDALVPRLVEALGAVARATPPFEVTLAGTGAFPAHGEPKILWVGLTSGVAELTRLAASVDEATAPLGFAREARPFTPHLTLARVKGRHVPGLRDMLQTQAGATFGSLAVREVVLFRSDTRPEGAVYTAVATLPLGGG